MREGDPAPFDGQLIPTERAVRLALRIKYQDERHQAELARLVRLHEIETKAAVTRGAIQIDAASQRAEIYRRELKEADAWYRSPVFIAVISSAATLLFSASFLTSEATAENPFP